MDVKLKSMFYKPIDRDIKGVIKVGQADDENIKQELEEYVVTEQLREHIDVFFESYKKDTFIRFMNLSFNFIKALIFLLCSLLFNSSNSLSKAIIASSTPKL